MRECPKCHNWSLDFDGYFGRFRCYNPSCGWMPSSSTERQIRAWSTSTYPVRIAEVSIPELGLKLASSYDKQNDALLFDFGLNEPAFDLPEPDGRLTWRIGRETGSVVGFAILGAKQLGVGQVRVNFGAKKQRIEERLKRFPNLVASGRPTGILVESVEVVAESDDVRADQQNAKFTNACNTAIETFEHMDDTLAV